jgi:hypothetical protein
VAYCLNERCENVGLFSSVVDQTVFGTLPTGLKILSYIKTTLVLDFIFYLFTLLLPCIDTKIGFKSLEDYSLAPDEVKESLVSESYRFLKHSHKGLGSNFIDITLR